MKSGFLIILLAGLAAAQSLPPIQITSISPASWTAGGQAFTLTINGLNLPEDDPSVHWNGMSLQARFVRIGQLSAPVPAALVAVPGRANITVEYSEYVEGVGFVSRVSNAALFTINPAATISPATLPQGAAGTSYQAQLSANGGTAPFRWFASGLPGGLSIDAATGAITGTPAIAGLSDITVQAADAAGVTVSRVFPLTIVPVISALAPPSASAGGPQFTLTISGMGFTPQSIARWNQTTLATTYVSATQLTAAVPAALTAAGGAASITVVSNGAPSAPSTFNVGTPPSITSLSPSSAAAGSDAFTLTVNGTGFDARSTVSWNNTTLPTTFVSAAQLTATVAATLLANQGSAAVTVVNANGLRSNAASFVISPPAPVITSLDPAAVTAGGAAFTLTVNGRNFVNQSAVRWNGVALTTTYVSATRLTAAVPPNLLETTSAAAEITVANPGNITSSPAALTINPPATPTISSLNPSAATAGGPTFNLTISGNNFVSTSNVYWNDTPLITTFASGTDLITSVPAALIASPGSALITVRNPLNSRSAAAAFRISLPQAPGGSITGLADTANPADQPRFAFSLESSYAFPITGRLVLTFTPETSADDPAVQFSSGGRTVNFSIPAGATNATFSTPNIALQTGTVAGTITLTPTIEAAGQALTALAPRTIRINRAAPVIRGVSIENRSANGFSIVVTGFATPREVTQAVFRFTGSGRGTLQTTDVQAPLTTLFTTWYQSAASAPFGSQFTLSQPFTVQQGDIAAIGSVSVTLVNSVGTSQAVAATF